MSIHDRILKKLEEGSRSEKRARRVIATTSKRMHQELQKGRSHSSIQFADKASDLQKKRSLRRKFRSARGDYTRTTDAETAKRHDQGMEGASSAYKAGRKRIIRQQGNDTIPSWKTLGSLEKEKRRSYARNVGKNPQVLDTPGKVAIMSKVRKQHSDVGSNLDTVIKRGAQLYRFKGGLRTKGVSPNEENYGIWNSIKEHKLWKYHIQSWYVF